MPTTILDALNLAPTTRDWLRDQVVYDDHLIRELTDGDLAELPLGQRAVLRGAFPNLRPHRPTNRIVAAVEDADQVVADVLAALARGDRSAQLLQLAEAAALQEVVMVSCGDCVDVEASQAYRAHRAEGHPRPPSGLWHDKKIVAIDLLIQGDKVRFNPLTGRPLQDGVDELSCVRWSKLSVERAALVHYGARKCLLDHMSEGDVFVAFSEDGPLATRCHKRLAVSGDRLDADIAFVTRGGTEADAIYRPSIHKSIQRPKITTTKKDAAMYQLLLGLFEPLELERWLRNLTYTDGTDLVRGLPSAANSSATLYMHRAAMSLESHGWLHDLNFFEQLIAERPRCRAEIELVRKLWVGA